MSYFLRNFIEARKSEDSFENEEDLITASTSKFIYDDPNKDIRNNYSKLLLLCAKALQKTGVLHDANAIKGLKYDDENLQTEDEIDPDLVRDVSKYVHVAAQPSCFGANMLAKTIFMRYGPLFNLENPFFGDKEHQNSLTMPQAHIPSEEKLQAKKNTDYQLVAIGLESIFSVMLELNQRDPELCVQALQSLLQLLQNLSPEALIHESKTSIEKMHSLLKQLRVDGNSAVSTYANACLVSLSIAYGAPEFLFSSICALLCDQKRNVPFNQISSDCNLLPRNFQNLAIKVQKCVQHGYSSHNDHISWWGCSLSEHIKLREYELVYPGSLSSSDVETPDVSVRRGCLVSDGAYAYVLTLYGLFKMGTGLTETKAGKVVNCNEILKFSEGSSLHICNESLYLRRRHSPRLWVIDTETLREIGEIMLQSSLSEGVLFSDGKCFLHGTMDEQWHFIITTLDDAFIPIPNQRLRHSTRLIEIEYGIFGDVNHIQLELIQDIPNNLQLVTADLQFGPEIAFLLTRHGRVYYTGKGSVIGLQDTNRIWVELDLDETIVAMNYDNHSKCLFLRSGSGHLWVVGTTSYVETRYSQGMSKKIKKVRIQNRRKCTSISSINGALAYVTDNGKSYLYGRHVVNTSLESGLIQGLDSLPIVNIALGKTHLVAISKSGLVYTSGLNNLNQCGREDISENQPSTSTKATNLGLVKTDPSYATSPSTSQHSPTTPYCIPGEHLFVKDVATICLRCGRCSGRGLKCPYANPSPNSPKPQSPARANDRPKLPRGAPCACGSGESTCLRCGICRVCADSANVRQSSSSQKIHPELESEEDEENLDGTPTKQRLTISRALSLPQQEAIIPPGRLVLQKANNDIKVSTVSCGNYHTILLCADRSIYTFGSNCHGQLGTGDTVRRNGSVKLNLPANVQVVQAVAGANHCVLRTLDGQIITFGAYKAGQLGREPSDRSSRFWFSEPGFVPGYGQTYGRIASWVGAQGDKTLIQTQKQIFSRNVLNDCYVTANRDCVLILPNLIERKPIVVLRKKTGVFYQIPRLNEDMSISWALDPHYNILWQFDAERMKVAAYTDVIESEFLSESSDQKPEIFKRHRLLVQTPELLIPSEAESCRYSDIQLAIYLLSTIYSLSVTSALVPNLCQNEVNANGPDGAKHAALRDATLNGSTDRGGYCMINRFENYGGGWGYSAHCVEAIQFKANKDFHFCGVGLFGGRGEYVAKLKLFRVIGGTEMEEQCVELLSETDEVLYECGPRETAVLQFTKNITIKAGDWHVLWTQIQGPSSDCGAGGQTIVRGEGDIEFIFRNSLLSNNGTDVDVGQIPEIYYRLVNENSPNKENSKVQKQSHGMETESDKAAPEKLPLIQSDILFSITPKTVTFIFKIFEWSIRGSFVPRDYGEMQDDEAIWRQERAGFIAILSLRMLRLYICILYSDEKAEQNVSIDILVDFHNLLNQLFAIADEKLFLEDRIGALVVDEAVDTFVACSQFLIPSPKIFQNRLNQAITKSKRVWSLLALLKSLCRLDKFILPLLKTGTKNSNMEFYSTFAEKLEEYFTPGETSTSENVEQMVPALPNDQNAKIPASSQRIIKFLFELAFVTTDSVDIDILIIRLKKAAQQLIGLISKELVLNKIKINKKFTLLQTPNRFRRTSSQINWDTGNSASDAIAFKVDIHGVSINGVGIYLGIQTVQYSYDLELLINTGDIANESWSVLEKGTGFLSGKYAETSTDKGITIIKFQKSVKLQPDVIYGIRLLLNGGKTLYGEGGICSVRLCNNGKIHFLPCSLSRNGTTIVRGQIPFLLYSIEEALSDEKQFEEFFEDQIEILEEKPLQNDIAKNLFILIIRLLARKLSIITASGEISNEDQALCSQIISYSNVFIEANPFMAFNIISAFDELLPLITSANADEAISSQKFDSSFLRQSGKSSRNFDKLQVLVESPHPYKSGQIYSQMINFEKNIEFICVRFHDECQTAQPEDILWIYGAVNGGASFVPLGRYSGSKDWPETTLLIPGNSLWFILETSVSNIEMDATKHYGYRCTVDGFRSTQNSPGLVLEEEFVWLCATACRLLVQAPTNKLKRLGITEQEMRELILKHGILLRNGLNLTHVPVLNEILKGNFPKTALNDQLTALKAFIDGKIDNPLGLVAKAITMEPYIDVNLCEIFVEDDGVYIGKPVRIILHLRDQFQREAYSSKIAAEVAISSADRQQDQEDLPRTETMQLLKQLQLQEPYHSVYLNKTRYKSITAMPTFSPYCFEELRLAYQQAFSHKETLKFEALDGKYTAQWIPKRKGRFRIDCSIDGFKTSSTTLVEVYERGTPVVSQIKSTTETPKQVTPKIVHSRASCEALSSFKGVRIRTHPTLSAQQIGTIPRGTTVSYMEQLRNVDGVWLRLTDEVRMLYCDPKIASQAWCLQYNAHLGAEYLKLSQTNGNTISQQWDSNIRIEYQDSDKSPVVDLVRIPRTPVDPIRQSNQATEALSPLTIDCVRTVFAAFLWHEHMVDDLLSCSNHIKSTPELQDLIHDEENFIKLPFYMQKITRIWNDVMHAVLQVIEQHLIMPSPPAMREFAFYPIRNFPHTDETIPSTTNENNQDELCELCEELYPKPITHHMRIKHPGCGVPSNGHGYNSIGNYTTGWSGNCGDGGRENAVWYLLCPSCRDKYLKNTSHEHQQARGKHWREFRMKTASKKLHPETIMKRNAMFLLELKSTDKKTNADEGLNIDLYPQFSSGSQQMMNKLEPDDEGHSSEDDIVDYTEPTIYRQYSHLSDPGSFLTNRSQSEIVSIHGVSSLSASANMFRPHTTRKSTRATNLSSLPSTSIGIHQNELPVLPYTANIFKHPIMLFVVENHDLTFIRTCFYVAISRAVRFAYAFRVWNWLLKMVTAENSVHDIIWHYIEALNSYIPLNSVPVLDLKFATKLRLLPHPWRIAFLSGDSSKQMVLDMHNFLSTLAVILQSNSVDIELKCLCFRAWTFQLTSHEQNLLLTMCNILSTVGAVLSDTSSETFASVFNESSIVWRRAEESHESGGRILRRNSSSHKRITVKNLENTTNFAKIECSSRAALMHFLIDESLDTFWESGDEDRNRVRRIMVSWDPANCIGMLVSIFIDNIRDEGYRINQITIKCIEKSQAKIPLYNAAIDRNYVGWIKCCVRGTNLIQIFLKGDEAGCRIRQLALHGYKTSATPGSPHKNLIKPSVSHQLLFSTAQMDAFMLFQAIAAQAFNDEFAEEYNGTLRQQVLEMLFSRTQLQPLQSYVCYQMVTAVEREIANLRDRSKKNYSYICALMIMLVKICEFRKGLEVFSMRNGLLVVLSESLLFSPEAVQYQVIETIGCLLKHFRPSSIDCSQFVINILAAVSKTISLQVKDRISRKISTQNMETNAMDLPQHWRTEKLASPESGHLLINLINTLTSGAISDQWAFAIRTELANTVMNLAKVFATSSLSSESVASTSASTQSSMSFTSRTALCLKTLQFWLAVAALGMINDVSWIELSPTWRSLKSRRSKEPDRLCENHDDGHTLAQYRCELCEIDLCRECFTILHLNKKKKNHQGRLIGSSNLCPKLDIHEGCTRLRINNLLILFNASKLNGMVEITADLGPATSFPYSSSNQQLSQPINIGKCRFCGNMLKSESEYLIGVCDYPECNTLAQYACEKILSCGHYCGGIKDEDKCLPCFYCQPSGSRRQDADDLCVICFVDRLGAAPSIQLKCGHLFHFNCVKTILEKKWAGPRIVFRFMHCPLCKQKIEHPALQDLLQPLLELYTDVAKKSKLRLEYDGLLNSPALTTENSEFYNDPVGFAMERYVYVLCAKCHKAYFGGESRCQEALEASNYNPEELVCGGCSDVTSAAVCGRHGTEFLEYKCRFCCSVAVYFCFGSTHFCSVCHSDFQRLMTLPKHLLPKCPVGPRSIQLENMDCPLKIQHPPTGEEFSLGCGICRNIRTF